MTLAPRTADLVAAVAHAAPADLTASIAAALKTDDIVVTALAGPTGRIQATAITSRGDPRPTVVWTCRLRSGADQAPSSDVATVTALIGALLLARKGASPDGPDRALVIHHGEEPEVSRETWHRAIPETLGVVAVEASTPTSHVDHVILTVLGRTAWVGAQHIRPHVNAVSEMRNAIRALKQADGHGWRINVVGILGGFTKEFLLTRPAQHADHCRVLLRVDPVAAPGSSRRDPVAEIGEVVARALSSGAVVSVVPAQATPESAWASGIDPDVTMLCEHIRRTLDATGQSWQASVRIRSGASDVALIVPLDGSGTYDIERWIETVASLMAPPTPAVSRSAEES